EHDVAGLGLAEDQVRALVVLLEEAAENAPFGLLRLDELHAPRRPERLHACFPQGMRYSTGGRWALSCSRTEPTRPRTAAEAPSSRSSRSRNRRAPGG